MSEDSGDNELDQDIDDLLGEMDSNESTEESEPMVSAADDTGDEPVAAIAEPAPVAATTGLSGNATETRKTIIVNGGREEDARDVFVSVNGRAYQIQRGVKVTVPNSVLHVLDNAVESKLVQISEGNHELRDFPRFSYQVVAD